MALRCASQTSSSASFGPPMHQSQLAANGKRDDVYSEHE